jgi:uncharacterized membrane protein YbhN (UPF0104 family)
VRRLPPSKALVAGIATLGLLAGAAFALATLDVSAVASALAGANRWLLFGAVAAYAIGQTLSGAMWSTCQRAGGVHGISLPTTLGLHWIARAACELLPASLGEAVRVGIVRRHPAGTAAGGWRITGGIGGYKTIDAAITAITILAIVMVAPLPGPATALRLTAVGIVVALLVGALAWRLGARRLGRALPTRIRSVGRRFAQGAGVLGDPRAASHAAGLGAAAIAARIISLAALLAAFGVPAQASALTFCVIALAGAIPLAPGGTGSREVILVPALAVAYGIPTATALAFSLAVQAVALGTSLAVGAVALGWLGPRLRLPTPAVPAVSPLPVEPALTAA